MTDRPSPPNPCIRVCCLDSQDYCLGCRRSLQEILEWHSMPPERQRQLLAELPLRQVGKRPDQAVSQSTTDNQSATDNRSTKRCFIGLSIPRKIRGLLNREMDDLYSNLAISPPGPERNPQPDMETGTLNEAPGIRPPPFRRVAPENYHITLAFLGNLDMERLHELQNLLRRESWFSQPLDLRIATLGGFPSVRNSRYIVAEIAPDPVLDALYLRLKALLEQADYPTEQRALRPHITLARAKRGVKGAMIPLQPLTDLWIRADRLNLYESRSGPDGSDYQVLAAFP